jgi:hypothetical protein
MVVPPVSFVVVLLDEVVLPVPVPVKLPPTPRPPSPSNRAGGTAGAVGLVDWSPHAPRASAAATRGMYRMILRMLPPTFVGSR